MRTEKSRDGILRRYVFDALDDDARLALEEQVVTEPEVFDALGVIEEELIEAYLEGTLSDAERQAFERHLAVSKDRRRQVSLIRMLKHQASAALDLAADVAFVPGMVKHLKAHPWWAGALAASVVALAGGNIWFVMARHGSEVDRATEVATEVAREVANELARSALARASEQALLESPPQPAPGERVAVPVPTAPATIGRVGQPGGAPRAAEPPTFALVADVLKGVRNTARVVVPDDAETIRLILKVETVAYPLYKVALRDTGGEDLWMQSKLNLNLSTRGAFLVVVLPVAVLAPGDYQARVSGKASTGQWTEIATYLFRVAPEDSTTIRFK